MRLCRHCHQPVLRWAKPPRHDVEREALSYLWMTRDVDAVLYCLTPREEQIVRLYWSIGERTSGIVGCATFEEIAARFAVSRERVRGIFRKACRKLLAHQEAQGDDVPSSTA